MARKDLTTYYGINSSIQNVAYTASVGNSTALPGGPCVGVVRLVATTACFYTIAPAGAGDVSATTGAYLPAGVIEYKMYKPGDRVSVIRAAADGSMNIQAQTT